MPIVKLPINYGPNKDIEEIGLVTHGAAMVDFMVDSNGNLMRRPGLVELCDLGTGAAVDGLYWWNRQSICLAVSDGNVFKITDSNGTKSDITSETLETDTRVTFAEWDDAVYMANGGEIIWATTTTTDDVYDEDNDVPTTVTHVDVIHKYLLALETDTEKLWFSEVDDPQSWDSDWVSAEAKFDLLKAMGVSNDEIYLVGSSTIEVWGDDGNTPLVKQLQGYVQSGIIAPYSWTLCKGTWYWLDDERKVVRLNGREPEVLSETMNKYIQDFTTVTDALGDYVNANGKPFYILSFPTEGKTLAFDIYNNIWAEWGYWNSGTSTHDRWRGNCTTLAKGWNKQLVGDRSNGKVYYMDSSTYQDNSSTLRSLVRTPHVNHGYQGIKKLPRSITFHVKRFQIPNSYSDTELLVKWRDNGTTTWKTERTIPLGQSGETDFRYKLNIGAPYYSRQYEVSFTDNAPLVLRSIEEDFEYLGVVNQ
jgi:hypothetical protein